MKPGYMTSEFWLALLMQVIAFCVLIGWVPRGDESKLDNLASSACTSIFALLTVLATFWKYASARLHLKSIDLGYEPNGGLPGDDPNDPEDIAEPVHLPFVNPIKTATAVLLAIGALLLCSGNAQAQLLPYRAQQRHIHELQRQVNDLQAQLNGQRSQPAPAPIIISAPPAQAPIVLLVPSPSFGPNPQPLPIAGPNPQPLPISGPNPQPLPIAGPNPQPLPIAGPNPMPLPIAGPNPQPLPNAGPNPQPIVPAPRPVPVPINGGNPQPLGLTPGAQPTQWTPALYAGK